MYCSQACRDEAKKRQNIESYRRVAHLECFEKTCVVCGKKFETYKPHKKTCSKECSKALRQINEKKNQKKRDRKNHIPWDEYIKIQNAKHDETLKRQKAEREARKETNKIEGICVVCGNKFITYNPKQKTCSKQCGRRWNYRNREKRLKDRIIDDDITLEALYKRDSGVCYICGGKCDWNDKTTNEEGYHISGDTYPTIDHIMPLAKGGMHSWDNIRLAHFRCNSNKRDDIPEDVEKLLPNTLFAYAYANTKKKKGSKKKVSQYTKDGVFLNTFESTVQAERETNVKQKGIQNCARGECKTYGGYVWKYI